MDASILRKHCGFYNISKRVEETGILFEMSLKLINTWWAKSNTSIARSEQGHRNKEDQVYQNPCLGKWYFSYFHNLVSWAAGGSVSPSC